MPNITLSIPEDLLKEGRKYAQKENTSLNALIREMLQKIVRKNDAPSIKKYLQLAKKVKADSGGWKFNRDEIYEHLLK